MEEYTQITLDEWVQWKEDIRRKLEETASNFVYIGYRLKQIRDSGMFGGAADVFEFAQNEYGLGKSTVSRFIAINEKYSEGGNSLELKEEFKGFSSSKLSEMLTLPDNEIQMITEKTTIRAIRELKKFDTEDPEAVKTEERAAGMAEGPERTPLEKCLIDFFESRKEMLNSVMKCLETDPPEYKQVAELMAPSGQAFHKKGLVFLFLYEWSEGVKYKLMTETDPVHVNWPDFLNIIYNIYGACGTTNVWEDFYGKEEQEKESEEKSAHAQSNQGSEPVATSQQKEEIETEESHEEKTEAAIPELDEQEKNEGGSAEGADRSIQGMDGDGRIEAEAKQQTLHDINKDIPEVREPEEQAGESEEQSVPAAGQEVKEESAAAGLGETEEPNPAADMEEQLPGQMSVEDIPGVVPNKVKMPHSEYEKRKAMYLTEYEKSITNADEKRNNGNWALAKTELEYAMHYLDLLIELDDKVEDEEE